MDEARKGHEVALHSMERLQAQLPGSRWVMVGNGSLATELRATATRLGLDGSVSWPGSIDDTELSRALDAAHAFCLLSREPASGAAGEGFGIAFVEAGAHGLPVIGGRIPGVTEAVKHGLTGILTDPLDPQAVADALARVLTDGALAQRLADAGRERARALSWPAVVDRYRTVISTVMALPPCGHPTRRLGWLADLGRGPR
jgi:glycosyltransferase involved in cell wall biosynthesis